MCTPKRDTMRLRGKTVAVIVLKSLLAVAFSAAVSNLIPAQQSQVQGPLKVQATPLPKDIDPSDPSLPVWMRPANAHAAAASSTPAPDVTPAAKQPQQPAPEGTLGEVTKSASGGFAIRVRSDEVTLQATVVDPRSRLVTNLGRDSFTVYEDNQQQQITSFRREDIPVSIGIVVDNSGSMRTKRNAVTKAVLNLVQASNSQDEVFIVNFNDEPYLDQDFTNNISLMHEALDRVDSRSGTALYDAVVASAEHLAKGAQREKKVLLVITDGDDNESRESLEQAIRSVQNENGPTIYTIGILGEEGNTKRFKRALEAMSLQTGGVAFFPKTLEEVDQMSQAVAHDIRNQYTITYKPTNPRTNGGYRAVRVVAHAPGYKELQVRTRSGYFATDQKTTSR
jgi:Ca-activated chloride channel family protein